MGELSLDGEVQPLTVGKAVEDVVGVEASSTLGAAATPGLRWYVDRFLIELFGSVGYGHLVLMSGAAIDDRSASGTLSVGAGMGPVWLSLALRGIYDDSDEVAYSYAGGSAALSAAADLGGIVTLRLSGSAHYNAFAAGRQDWLVRASFAPSVKVVDGVWIEGSYGYAMNFSSEASFDASRHFVYLGIRVERAWRN
ncbi:MAG: hypothetical protein QM765_17625 [Myxococcales bacterium]